MDGILTVNFVFYTTIAIRKPAPSSSNKMVAVGLIVEWRGTYWLNVGGVVLHFYGKQRLEHKHQQKSFVTMRNSQHTEKKHNFKNETGNLKWLCPLDNEEHYIGH